MGEGVVSKSVMAKVEWSTQAHLASEQTWAMFVLTPLRH
jgi:hypothetical protein